MADVCDAFRRDIKLCVTQHLLHGKSDLWENVVWRWNGMGHGRIFNLRSVKGLPDSVLAKFDAVQRDYNACLILLAPH